MHLFAIPRSLNVERVTLALGYKDLPVEVSLIDPRDRTQVREASGQELVPVLVDDDGTVVFDSPVVLEHLERRHPEPPLWPEDPARRAEVDVFIDWFNRVWKRPPNQITDEMTKAQPDEMRIQHLGETLTGSLDRFERLLHGRMHLFGDEFSAADCIAFPFLQYALGIDDNDRHLFHQVLARWLATDRHPRLADWIRRVDARPRAGNIPVHELESV
ncbi:MAG TPA: glutathione S-transferase family protein [Gemmatimonadota bacterium]|nr:glutathione S-transferase family protein [Gemmatimonadota bacterium]